MKLLTPTPTNVSAADFKARCLHLMDQVHLKKGEIIVTKYGKPVAKMVPLNEEAPELFGLLGQSVTYHGNIVAPTGEVWMPTPERLLLDTHVWIWLMDGAPGKISAAIRSRIHAASGKGLVYVSAISIWEVATLEAKGRITFSMDCREWVDRALAAPGLQLAPLTPSIAVDSTRLPEGLHGDPADRILVATARSLHGTLITRDALILDYSKKGHVHTTACAA